MIIVTEKLIHDLRESTQKQISQTENLHLLTNEELNWRPGEDSWSILECLEHLNLYGDFYIPEMEKSIKRSNTVCQKNFRSGILGNYFAKAMLPREKLNKMKTFKSKNPIGSALDKTTIKRFIRQQKQLLDLLNQAKKIDLSKTKTGTTISRFVKLKIGDVFRVVIYHNERHLVQINKIKRAYAQQNQHSLQ